MMTTKNMTDIQLKAWKIGVAEAHTHGCIVPAARSKDMMQLIRDNSKNLGDSIPWLEAYNYGVAVEIGVQTALEL